MIEKDSNNRYAENLLSIHLAEYDKLKTEQIQRIGFRDNLLYVTLGVFGAVFSYAISNVKNYDALLVLPWVAFVLGWTYLINDEKISAIGSYLRFELNESIKLYVAPDDKNKLGWEFFNVDSEGRHARKWFQLFVNLVAFCLSGLVALAVFVLKVPVIHLLVKVLLCVDVMLIIVLGIWFCIHSGFGD